MTTTRTFTCLSSTINGSAPTDPSTANPVADITGGSFSGCTGPLASTGSVTVTSADFNAVAYDSGTDTVNGNLTKVSGTFTFTNILGTCVVTVSGSIGTTGNTVTYANSTGTLTIPPDPPPQQLKVTGTSGSGCLLFFSTGDPVIVSATYQVADPGFTIEPA